MILVPPTGAAGSNGAFLCLFLHFALVLRDFRLISLSSFFFLLCVAWVVDEQLLRFVFPDASSQGVAYS